MSDTEGRVLSKGGRRGLLDIQPRVRNLTLEEARFSLDRVIERLEFEGIIDAELRHDLELMRDGWRQLVQKLSERA